MYRPAGMERGGKERGRGRGTFFLKINSEDIYLRSDPPPAFYFFFAFFSFIAFPTSALFSLFRFLDFFFRSERGGGDGGGFEDLWRRGRGWVFGMGRGGGGGEGGNERGLEGIMLEFENMEKEGLKGV